MEDRLLSIGEVAKRLGMTEGRIYQLVRAGSLPGATHSELVAGGVNPRIIRSPKCFVKQSEVEQYATHPRKEGKPPRP